MPPVRRPLAVLAAATLALGLTAGCGSASDDAAPAPVRSSSAPASPSPTASSHATTPPSAPAPTRHQPRSILAGKVIGIDPGHNGANHTDLGFIDHQIWNGRGYESCNTTGTATNAGYPEATYTWGVATTLRTLLLRAGAKVVMTRHDNHSVGPCVDQRAKIINNAHADVAIDIHGDGAPAGDRGFTILQPVPSGTNDAVVPESRQYARILRDSFEKTGMPVSNYSGSDGLTTRDDLAGLNLTTVPQVLLECGNMRNAQDAALLTSPAFQRKAASRIMAAMAAFLQSRSGTR